MAQNRIPPRRGQYAPVKQTPLHNADTIQDEDEDNGDDGDNGYDDVWPPRLPNNARRYPQPADVQKGSGYARTAGQAGRTRPDVQTLSSQSSWRKPDADDEYQSTIPPRRRATQTGIPAVQPQRRRPVQTDDVDVSQAPLPRTEALQNSGRKRRLHWLVFVGGAMLLWCLAG